MSTSKNSFAKCTLFFLLLWLAIPTAVWAQNRTKCDAIIDAAERASGRNEYAKSQELYTQARMIADKNNWHEQQFLAINGIGANYYHLLEYGEAFKYFLEAYTIAIQHLKPDSEMVALNNIAILYSEEKKYDKAQEYFKKAVALAIETKENKKIGMYLLNLGDLALLMENTKLARSYYNESFPYLKKVPNLYNFSKMGLAECDLADGNATQARLAATALLTTTKNWEFNNFGQSLQLIITRAYLKENKFAEAAGYARTILDKKVNIDIKVQVFELLSEIYLKQKNYTQAFQFKDSIINANKILQETTNNKLYESSKVRFEVQDYKNKLELNEAQLTNERRIFYSVGAIVLIIVFFIFWILRNRSIKHKQRKQIAERNEQILVLELEREKDAILLKEKQFDEKEAIALLEQERLKNEVEQKNRKLSAKALYLSGRNELIEEVLSDLSKLPQVARDASLLSHIYTLKNHLKTDNEWDSFITHFEEVNQTFITTLKTKYPELTSNDVRFLSYQYMNLSGKEIASILNITPDGCRKRKERITAKMKLPQDINLYDYLTSL